MASTLTASRVRYNAQRLAEDIAERGLMPSHLARLAGVHERTVTRFLNGEVQTAKSLKKFADALGVSPRRYLIREAA